jgi:hypothetical protein
MRADYHIDSDAEELLMPGAGTKILNYSNLNRLDGNDPNVIGHTAQGQPLIAAPTYALPNHQYLP